MEQNFNPLNSQRDAIDFVKTMSHLNNQEKQNALLAEQVRLQREANELKKKELEQQKSQRKQHRLTQQEALIQMEHIAQQLFAKRYGQSRPGNLLCYGCKGTLLATCPDCSGKGTRFGWEEPCKNCNGAGRVPCSYCCGDGHLYNWKWDCDRFGIQWEDSM